MCQPWTGLISCESSLAFSFCSLLHVSFRQYLLYSTAFIVQERLYVLRLMKMIYSVSYPSHILDTLWTSCYIPNKFEVRSRYSSCILFGFLDVRTVFGSHSVCILTEFVWHSMHIPTRLQTLFEQQSSGDAFVRHSKYILNILIIFLLCYDYIPVAFES